MEWYRDNGVLKVRRSSKPSSSAPKKMGTAVGKRTGVSYLGSGYGVSPTSGPKVKTTTGTGARKKHIPKPSDFEAKRDNGVFKGFQKTAAAKAAARRADANKKATEPKPMSSGTAPKPTKASPVVKKQAVAAAKRKQRQMRIKEGEFKGKYYGPDAFKGNTAKIDAWKKAGKPEIKKFLNK